jgi:hypothetical protein
MEKGRNWMSEGAEFGIGMMVGWFTAFVFFVLINYGASGYDISTGRVRDVHAKIEIVNETKDGESWQRFILPLDEANKCKVGDMVQIKDDKVTVLTPVVEEHKE